MTVVGTIEINEFLPYPPARVWRALVNPQMLARWLMPNDFEPRVGHRFTFRCHPVPAANFDGAVHCKVLAVVPERLLRISWDDRSGSGLESTVTWRLESEGRGTRLLLEHAGFDLTAPLQFTAYRGLGQGWRRSILASLHDALADRSGVRRRSGALPTRRSPRGPRGSLEVPSGRHRRRPPPAGRP